MLVTFPGACIYEFGPDGAERVSYAEALPFRLIHDFVQGPDQFLRHLFADDT